LLSSLLSNRRCTPKLVRARSSSHRHAIDPPTSNLDSELEALGEIIELCNLGRGGSIRRVIGGSSTSMRSVISEDFSRK
jgi:hypothetical protein